MRHAALASHAGKVSKVPWPTARHKVNSLKLSKLQCYSQPQSQYCQAECLSVDDQPQLHPTSGTFTSTPLTYITTDELELTTAATPASPVGDCVPEWFQPEFEQLMAQLSGDCNDSKLDALNRIIEHCGDAGCSVQLQQGDQLPRLMDNLTKLLSSWVSGGLDIAALAAEALCRVLAMEVRTPEVEAAVLRCVRPTLQLLSSSAQPPVQGAALPATFFAASALVRAAAWPAAVEDAVRQGATRVLVSLLRPAQPQLLQVAVFALFKLRSCASDADALLVQMAEAGGFHDLCRALWPPPGCEATALAAGPASEMIFSLLMDLAACSGVQRLVSANGGVASVVRALQATTEPSARLQAVLVLCRLTCHSSECQLACLKESTVPTVVSMMEGGAGAEKVHAARLAAILAQHPAAHEAFRLANVMRPLVAMLRSGEEAAAEQAASVAAVLAHNPAMHSHMLLCGLLPPLLPLLDSGACPPDTTPTTITARICTGPWLAPTCTPTCPGMAVDDVCHTRQCPAGPCSPVPRTPAELAAACTACLPLSPDPASPLSPCGSHKAKGYVLSAVLLLAMSEGRHSMALVHEGAVARLVDVAKGEADPHLVEYAAAVLGQLSRNLHVQPEVVGGGAIPALVKLLRSSSPDGQAHAAEALAHLASPTSVRKRLIARAGVLGPLTEMLAQQHPESRYWAANLLQVLSQEPSVLAEMVSQGVCHPLVALLAARPCNPSEPELLQAQAQACWVMVRLAGHQGLNAGQVLAQVGAVPLLMRLVRRVQPAPTPAAAAARVPLQLDALEHNAHAAAMAALLALRSAGSTTTMDILQAAAVELWCGHAVRLHGLTAADHHVQ